MSCGGYESRNDKPKKKKEFSKECGTINRSRHTVVTCGTVESAHGQAKIKKIKPCELHSHIVCARLNCIHAHCHDDAPNRNSQLSSRMVEKLPQLTTARARAAMQKSIFFFFSSHSWHFLFDFFLSNASKCVECGRAKGTPNVGGIIAHGTYTLCSLCQTMLGVAVAHKSFHSFRCTHTHAGQTERSRRTQFATGFATRAQPHTTDCLSVFPFNMHLS